MNKGRKEGSMKKKGRRGKRGREQCELVSRSDAGLVTAPSCLLRRRRGRGRGGRRDGARGIVTAVASTRWSSFWWIYFSYISFPLFFLAIFFL